MGGKRYAALSLASSATLTLAKGVAALLTNSLAIWAETFDSILDIVNTAMGFAAIEWSSKPPDLDHAYGHGKVESLVAYTETVFIFGVIGYIVYESIQRMLSPKTLGWIEGGLHVLLVTMVADALIALVNYHGYKKTDSHVLRANYVNFMGDVGRALVVIVSLHLYKLGYLIADPLFSLFIASLLGKEGYELLRETTHVLLDAVPRGVPEKAREIALGVDGVIEVRSVRARSLGKGVYLDIVVGVDAEQNVEEAHRIASEVENRIKAEFRDADVVVHVEPA